MTHLLCVPPDKVPEVWPMVSHMIDAAYAELDEVTPDVQSWLASEKGLLWIAIGREIVAAMTSSIVPMRRGLALRMVSAGGGALDSWKDHIAQIEEYAKAEGCYKVICDGRRGWERILPGYAPKSVCLEKVL